MVSPSKLQQQPHQSARLINEQGCQKLKVRAPRTTAATSTTTSSIAATTRAAASIVRIQKGPKPLEKKRFYLDIKNYGLSSKLEAKIKEFGGEIELFLVKNVSVVVTDRSGKTGQATASEKRKWGYASGESGGFPSLKSIEVPTPTPTPPTPYRSVEGPLSNSTNQRGPTTQRSKSRADAMLERALTQPQQCSVDPLNNALSWGIPIWSTYELQTWLEKIANSLKDSYGLKRDIRTTSGKELKIKHLKEPYIKFESYQRESRPVFLELQAWPTIHFDGDAGTCPFDVKRKEKKEAVNINKDIKENREKSINHNKLKVKDMTRRPRATAARAQRTENIGHCEICRIDYRNLSKHLQSDQHLSFVGNDKNFLSLDNLISTGASVEAFLKINRSKDISKDCSLFSSRDNSLDNGILSPDEKLEKKDKSNSNDFSIEEIRMVQCNGARRNLNLDSPHNLRTRAKHESGHLLRSKGRPLSEEEKIDKSFDKFTIKKRAKGTIWIEEEDSEDEQNLEIERESRDENPCERLCDRTKKNINISEIPSENVSVNGDINRDMTENNRKEGSLSRVTVKNNAFKESFLGTNLKTKINGYEKKEEKYKVNDVLYCPENDLKEVNRIENDLESINFKSVYNFNNGEKIPHDSEDTNSLNSLDREDRAKSRPAKRGGRSFRGRQRLSVEERLIEDNRDYYKVEVLGNKLRSSAIPSSNVFVSPLKEQTEKSKKDEKPSSEKPVVVRFKRVRKSELSLLSDEAESFMFGDSRREDEDSENSDGEQSSILPKDTESDREEAVTSLVLTSSPKNLALKQQINDDELQDLTNASRAKKRRRTQTEALIKDNADYYKFETPGSRLRYQAPLTGICDVIPDNDPAEPSESKPVQIMEKIYPSKPSPEIEKMHFSFEAVPKSEPWYQTYQRQDEGAEFWHYFSECDSPKPFLLPYEIENFHEILQKSLQSSVHRKRGRSRGSHVNMGNRSPRKSPRCHASTLAIMSTIIRRREQQQSNLSTIEEERKTKTLNDTSKSEKKCSEKSDVDQDLKEIVKNLDEMLSNDMQELDSFEMDFQKNTNDLVLIPEVPPKGAPSNLLELLDNVHDSVQPNGIENSSCASSECGELTPEFPSRRRKKRKNKTGWPGNKMRRKLHIKNLAEELQKELNFEKRAEEENLNDGKSISTESIEDASSHVSHEDEDNESELETVKENEQVLNTIKDKGNKGRRNKTRESKQHKEIKQEGSECSEANEIQSKSVFKSVFCEEITLREKLSDTIETCKIEQDEDESNTMSEIRNLDNQGTLLSISEDSEASLSNNENLCTKDTNSLLPHEKLSPSKHTRKRQKNISLEMSYQNENRKRSSVSSSPTKKLQKIDSDSQDVPLESPDLYKKNHRKSKKHKQDRTPSKVISEDGQCRKETFLSVSDRRRLKRVRRNDSVSSELQNGEIDSELSERVSPSLMTSPDVDQRRTSIDFQPVVRVMKIEDQVDMDNSSILSVAVASNRRLRSSSSPRSSMQPPKKRYRHSSGKRQWIKNS